MSDDDTVAEISAQGFSEIWTTTLLNFIIGAGMYAVFEIKRRKKSVYGARLTKLRHRAPPQPPMGLFGWAIPVMNVKGKDFLRMAGMDAYMLVRFCRLCCRVCTFGTVWGLLVLAPIYAYGGGGATGFYRITLANVASGSNFLWATVVFAYLFTWHVLHLLRMEFRKFADIREDFLARGDPDFLPQTRYSALVERVPSELRSNVALKAFFERVFPGEVHSAVMCLDLGPLEALVAERQRALERLEKAQAIAAVTGAPPEHRTYHGPCDCFGTPSGLDSISVFTQELQDLNERVAEEQAACRDAANQLSQLDDEILSHTSRQMVTRLDSIAQRVGPAAWAARANGSAAEGSDADIDIGGGGGGGGGGESSQKGSTWQWLLRLGKKAAVMEEVDTDAEEDTTASGSSAAAAAAAGAGGRNSREESGAGEAATAAARSAAAQAALSGGASGDSEDQRSPLVRNVLRATGAKDALSALAFVGDEAINATRKAANNVLYLTLGRRMSTTGFVTFTSLTAEASATQVLLTHRPQVCEVAPAPEQRDVMWDNIAIPKKQTDLRLTVANILFALGAIFWAIPVAFVQAVTSISELSKVIPFLSDLSSDSLWYSLLSGYLPVLALLGLINVLPYFFQFIAETYEGCKSRSGVQLRVMTRYYYYQLANIWITVTAGSIFDSLYEILEHPKDIFEILGKSFPSVAVYFVDLIIVKIFSGLTLELSRLPALARICWEQRCSNKRLKTQRELRTGAYAAPELQYGWVYPNVLLVLITSLVYALIAPFVMPIGAIYFALAGLVYKHQALYVYVPQYESGGTFWYPVFSMALIGLVAAQVTLIGYVALRGGFYQSPVMIPLPLIVIWFGMRSASRYNMPSTRLSLERARQLDAEQVAARGGAGPAEAAEGVVATFNTDLYAQPVLTAPEAVALPYRDGWDDKRDAAAAWDGGDDNSTVGGCALSGGSSESGEAESGGRGGGSGGGQLRAPLLKDEGVKRPSYGGQTAAGPGPGAGGGT